MDRRAIYIEEAAGITMYKTKRAPGPEAKLEASKINLSRVNDILVEAGKAARFAEAPGLQGAALRRVARADARPDARRAREQGRTSRYPGSKPPACKSFCAIWMRPRSANPASVRELETEQERLSSRTYELDGELRQTQNLCQPNRT